MRRAGRFRRGGFGLRTGAGIAAAAIAAATTPADAIHVYILASGDPTLDARVQAVLTAHGHTSVIGQFWTQFDGSASLAGFDAVYAHHIGFSFGDMPQLGQVFLRDWVRAGGGLVTGAGAVVEAGEGRLAILQAVLPAEPSAFTYYAESLTFEQVAADPVISNGLPATFTFSAMAARGVDCFPRAGATGYYQTAAPSLLTYGLVGGTAGAGAVATIGLDAHEMQYDDANFSRLLANSLMWSSSGALPSGVDIGVGVGATVDVCTFSAEEIESNIHVWNYGAAASGPVTLTVDLPPASIATYASATPAPTSVSATTLTFDLAPIAGGGFTPVAVTLTAQDAGLAVLTATVSATGDVDSSNNTAAGQTTIHGIPPQVHLEVDDAPELAGGQPIDIIGTVEAIEGSIGFNEADMYLFRVDDWSVFSASTAADPVVVGACGDNFTAGDTSLFLFDSTGRGIAFNEDGVDARAVLEAGNPMYANRADGETVWLAISAFDYDPVAGGAELWADQPWEVTRGPDGPASAQPMDGWSGGSAGGTYRITLTGASAVTLAPGVDLAAGVGMPLCVVNGQDFEVAVVVQNLGSAESAASTLTVELPPTASASYSSATPPPTSTTPTTLTFEMPPIAGGQFAEVIIDMTAQSAGTAAVAATVSTTDDLNPANNSATAEVMIEGQAPPPQVHLEVGDAPFLDGGQQPGVSGTLTAIEGTLFPNDADMYVVRIDDWSAFSATTFQDASVISPCIGGGAVADTALFLFDAAGHGIAFNEDGAGVRGYLEAGSPVYTGRADGEMVWIAVANYDFDPASNGGEIWQDGPFETTRGPDGPAAAGAVNGWTGESFEQGTYRINFTGVSGVPACAADLDGSGEVDVFDLLAYLDLWFTGDAAADLDASPGVDVFDLLLYLDGWFTGC